MEQSSDETATEYYWDEETQTYYYWDEDTQAYYPWVDTATEEPPTEEPPTEKPPTEKEPPEEKETRTREFQQNDEDSSYFQSQKEKTVESETQISNPPPQGEEHFQRASLRGLTRRLSLAEHGGLAGVLQIVNAERKINTLSDDEIKAARQKEKLRDMLMQAGLIQESSSISENKLSEQELPEHSNPNMMPSQQESVRGVFRQQQNQPQEERCEYPLKNCIFIDRRRSTIRFGTEDFNNPEFQSRVEQMLGRTLKKFPAS